MCFCMVSIFMNLLKIYNKIIQQMHIIVIYNLQLKYDNSNMFRSLKHYLQREIKPIKYE